MTHKHLKVYHSRKHLAITIFFVVIPFLFLFVFSRVAHIESDTLFYDLFISLVRLIVSYIIAVCVGLFLALIFFRGKRALIALPFFDVLQSFPTFAALPLAVYFFGQSTFVVILFLSINILWPILFSVLSALRMIKSDWEDAVTIVGLGGFAYIRHFLWPLSLPALVTGSVIGLGEGWEALIATEIIVNMKTGLGSFFQSHSSQTFVTVFGILGFLIIIFSINKLLWIPLMERSHRLMEE